MELSQAQLNQTQAEIQDVNSKYDFENNNAILQYQVGTLRWVELDFRFFCAQAMIR